MHIPAATFAVALLAAPAAHASPVAPDPTPIAAATPCDLAGVLLRRIAAVEHGQRVIYDATPYQPLRLSRGARDPGPPPGVPADLAARWNASGPGNLLAACPAVAKALPAGMRLATDAEREAVRRAAHAPMIHRISAPVTNAAGDRVLIEVASQCAGLCGAGTVMHFRKTARGWVEEPNAAMWMS